MTYEKLERRVKGFGGFLDDQLESAEGLQKSFLESVKETYQAKLPESTKYDAKCLDVEYLGLSARALTTCDRTGCYTLGDIAEFSPNYFKHILGCGKKTIKEFETILKQHGLNFGTRDPDWISNKRENHPDWPKYD